jgi:hypothetical protein
MATTFATVQFRNMLLDCLTGRTTSPTTLKWVQLYNGTQPADPSAAPSGTAVFSATTAGYDLATRMSAAGGGISSLTAPLAATTPASAGSVSGLTFARIFNAGPTAVIDTDVALSGGGDVTLSILSSSVGVPPVLTALSYRMPLSNGTLRLSTSLANRIVDVWTGVSAVVPQMGVNTNGGSTISLYSGTPPASADDAPTGTLCATFTLGGTNMWNSAVGGAASLNGAGPTVTASGGSATVVTYFRWVKTYTAGPTFTVQGTVGTVSGASDMLLNTDTLTSGVTSVQITDATISLA